MTQSPDLAGLAAIRRISRGSYWVAAMLLLTSSRPAAAQTWAGNNRQRPSLREIATIDATGEPNWLWGQEDVTGDGLNQFTPNERAIDARSVYLRVDDGRLWWRTYLSSSNAPNDALTAYLFVDSDTNAATGRSAAATELDPAFTTDPSLGGYEYVVSVRGDGSAPTVWELNAGSSAFVETTVAANLIDGESNVSLDPLRIGSANNGYVQASVASTLVSVDARCQARFYVRTTNQTQNLGPGDLDVGESIHCIPVDVNTNDVPDLLEPTAQCTSNDQCPNDGICWNNRCWLAPVCLENVDCPANSTCQDGRCIVTSGANCTEDDDCFSGICQNGRCVACTSDGACGAGRVCGPDGRCVDESNAGPGAGGNGNTGNDTAGASIVLADGERIQGGPCACRFASNENSSGHGLWLLLGAGLTVCGRRKHVRRGSST